MYRIYCDSNSRDEDGRYDLAILGSRRDIEPIEDELRVGMHVIIYDTGDGDSVMEYEAVLDYDSRAQRWMASPIFSTFRRVPVEDG